MALDLYPEIQDRVRAASNPLEMAGVSAAVLHSVGPVLIGRLSGNRLGFGMGFWMVGALADVLGMRQAFLACAVLSLLGTPFILWLPGRTDRVK